jgi:hypothetical protein
MPPINSRSTRLWGDTCSVVTSHSTSIAFFARIIWRSKFYRGAFLAHIHGIACWSPQKRISKHPVHRAWYCSSNCTFGSMRFLFKISASLRPSWGFKYALILSQADSYSEKSNKMQQCIKILLFIILNKAQHVLGETPPIIRSLKLRKQPLVLHTWKVVGRAVVGRCRVATWQSLTTAGPTTFHGIMQNQSLLVKF